MAKTSRTPRAYALENAAFLRHLRRTGNAHEAARAMDLSRSRFTKRRAQDPAFALRWDAALVFAQAALTKPGPSTPARSPRAAAAAEPVLTLCKDGTAQLRRALKSAITPQAEQAFLFALAASANVRLAAAAAGFTHASFYARKRRHPAFARQWQAALEQGYERVTLALHASWAEEAHTHDAWAHNAPPPVPPMTASQALQLLYLHQKEARGLAEPGLIARRRGESPDVHAFRMGVLNAVWEERQRETFRAAEAARRRRGEGAYWGDDLPDPNEPSAPIVPDLAQVTGWSKARPKPVEPPNPDDPSSDDLLPDDLSAFEPSLTEARALFGGWRIDDWHRAVEDEKLEIISIRPARGKGSRGPRKKRGGAGDEG